MRDGGQRPAGASLIEAILVIVILGIGVSMILKVMAPGTGQSHRPEMVARAVFLGQDLLEEIRSKDFEDPPPGSFGTEEALPRLNYDDVDDFDNWGPTTPPQDLNDAPLAQFGGFSRSVTVCNVDESDLDTCVADGSTSYKQITVTVSWSEGSISLKSLRADH